MNFESAEYNIHNNLSLQQFLKFDHESNFSHFRKVFRFIYNIYSYYFCIFYMCTVYKMSFSISTKSNNLLIWKNLGISVFSNQRSLLLNRVSHKVPSFCSYNDWYEMIRKISISCPDITHENEKVCHKDRYIEVITK